MNDATKGNTMDINEIKSWGRTMSTDEIKACQGGVDDDGTPLFPPEPLDEHWNSIENLVGRKLTDDEEAAFAEAFSDVAFEAATRIGW